MGEYDKRRAQALVDAGVLSAEACVALLQAVVRDAVRIGMTDNELGLFSEQCRPLAEQPLLWLTDQDVYRWQYDGWHGGYLFDHPLLTPNEYTAWVAALPQAEGGDAS